MRKHKKLYTLVLAVIVLLALVYALRTGESGNMVSTIADIAEMFTDTDSAAVSELFADEKTPDHSGAKPEAAVSEKGEAAAETAAIDENGSYSSKEDVALYIYTYGHLPSNFITKKEAQNLGWSGGSLEKYAPGMSIGGDRFGNYEGLLPNTGGRKWTECDINTAGASSRGAERIVFSNDGLIYYTADHYESFELLYGQA